MQDFEQLNHYELLDIARNATPEEIKRAYRKQISIYHPDRNVHKEPAEQAYASNRTRQINEAYRVLSDPQLRRSYDRGERLPTSAARRGTTVVTYHDGPPPPGEGEDQAARDQQAELYVTARRHIAAGRHMQAAATLRELQRINPFYRDSAVLLQQAEAASRQGKNARRGDGVAGGAGVRRKWVLVGGTVVAAGLLAAVVLAGPGLPSMFNSGDEGSSAAAVEVQSATPTEDAVIETATFVLPTALPEDTVMATVPALANTTAPTARPTVAETSTATTEVIVAVPTPGVGGETLPTSTPVPVAEATATEESAATPTPSPAVGEGDEEVVEDGLQGDVVFADVFEDSRSGWPVQEGNGWSVGYSASEGAYLITAAAGIGDIWVFRTAAAAPPGRYVVVSDVRVQNGLGGVVANYVDETTYLAAFIDPLNGTFAVEQRSLGTIAVLSSGESSAIESEPGARNRVALRVDGIQVQLLINGQLVADTTSPETTPTNLIGLIAHGRIVAGDVRFEQIQVQALN